MDNYINKEGLDAFWAKVKDRAAKEAADAAGKKADKATTLAGYGITDAYTKQETDNKIKQEIASVYQHKGVVATTADLPTTNNKTGDVWHVNETSAEYVWDGSKWEELGTAIDLSGYLSKEEANRTYAAKQHSHTIAEVNGLQTALDGKATAAQGDKADTALQPEDLQPISIEYIESLS